MNVQAFLVSQVLAVATLCFCKCAALALVARALTLAKSTQWLVCLAFMVVSAAWGIGATSALLAGCKGSALLLAGSRTVSAECPHMVRNHRTQSLACLGRYLHDGTTAG